MRQFDGNETELVVGKLRGFRSWQVQNFMPQAPWGKYSRLKSLSHDIYWTVNNMQARCPVKIMKQKYIKDYTIPHPHQAPYDGCTCGIYGHYSFQDTRAYNIGGGSKIYGAFDAWGKVLLGEKGFRCQYAKIVALISTYDPARLRHIASYYRVPYFTNYKEFNLLYPSADLSVLLPQRDQVRGFRGI